MPYETSITTDATEIRAVKMSLLRFFSQKCSATSGAMAMVSNMMAKGMTIHNSTLVASCIIVYRFSFNILIRYRTIGASWFLRAMLHRLYKRREAMAASILLSMSGTTSERSKPTIMRPEATILSKR